MDRSVEYSPAPRPDADHADALRAAKGKEAWISPSVSESSFTGRTLSGTTGTGEDLQMYS